MKEYRMKFADRMCLFKNVFLIYCFLCLSVGLFTAFYLAHEDMIYLWDYFGYHDLWITSINIWKTQGLTAAFQQILDSIEFADYNSSPLVLLLPWGRLFGCTRLSYLCAVAFIYLVPSGMLLAEMIFSVLKASFSSMRKGWVYGIVFLSAPLWCPFLRGFVDVAVLLPLTICTWLFLKDSFVTKRRILAALSFGLCLYLCFLFRRWMAFAVIAFALSALPFVIHDFLDRSIAWKNKVLNLLLHGACAGTAFLTPMILLQWKKIIAIAGTDYGVAHAPWAFSLKASLYWLAGYFSFYLLAFAFLSVAAFWLYKKIRISPIIFCWLYSLIYVFSFIRLEMLGRHHSYGFLPQLLLLVVAGVFGIAELLKKQKRLAVSWLIFSCLCFSFIWTFSFMPFPGRNYAKPDCFNGDNVSPFHLYKSLPFRYAGINGLIQFVYQFNSLLEKNPSQKFSNLGAGFTFNESNHVSIATLLSENQHTHYLQETVKRHTFCTIVDSLDPQYPGQVFSIDYLLILSPFEGHADMAYHQIPYHFGKSLVTGKNIGKAYELVMEHPLLSQYVDGYKDFADPQIQKRLLNSKRYLDYHSGKYVVPSNLKILVYKRKRDPSDEEKVEFAEAIAETIHPSLKAVFQKSASGLSFFSNARYDYDKHAGIKLVKKESANSVMMHPWHTPSALTLNPNQKYSSAKMEFHTVDSKGDVVLTILLDGKVFKKERSHSCRRIEAELPLHGVRTITFSVDCNGSPNYDTGLLTISDIRR